MEALQIIVAGLTAIILFVFGLEHFSREIENISGDRFRHFISTATRVPVVGLILGAGVTAVIQSSSATSVIAISLVNAGVLSFKNSVGIIFGSNIGTTITAQLVAFKLTAFAPALIIAGFALSLTRTRYAIFGKSIFYFGFVFFSLQLISSALAPLQQEPALVEYLIRPQNPLLAILIGCVFTALVQSSSVTTGLAIIFTQQGLLGLENAIPLLMGANIGTTATALIAMVKMDLAAKKTALSHFLFNVGGVVIFLPVFFLFESRLADLNTSPAIALANIHLVFNIGTSLVFLILINPFTRLIESLLGEGKMDFERIKMPSQDATDNFAELQARLEENLGQLMAFQQENYNLVSLSIETNYRNVYDVSARRLEYVSFLERENVRYFSRAVSNVSDEAESRKLLTLITLYDYLFQIHDSIEDLFNTKLVIDKQYIELKSDVLLMVREISSDTLVLFDIIQKALLDRVEPKTHEQATKLQTNIDNANRELLKLLAHSERKDAGALMNFATYSRRLKDKLLRFSKLATRSLDLTSADEEDPSPAPSQASAT
ncbi:Na/Pi cotransporter family protein [Halieaceae bacterium IMCC14734]|uniref:Na/Pi cotransporter family protein n=1 Tax=Candidatus Litorirhabdus singularis TaxID=2518993 RepID=A0ABT3TK37_9GAMM|nr:Na/Pi symporter [Candidatus Litorirhabdus singularis]MCX2982605.1 Na/Pi cotransporter family protein [Candidatus Litorirhabdus singularis]